MLQIKSYCHPEGGTHALRSQARFAQGRATERSIQLVVFGAGAADPSQANVILSEASLRAKSKDPHLVASSAWVADPSQVPMPCGHHRGMKMPPKRPPRDLFHRKLRMTFCLWRTRNVREAVQS